MTSFQLQRYFSITAFFSTLIAVILLTLFFRQIFEAEIVSIGERNNLTLTRTSLNSVKHDLIQYLDTVQSVTDSQGTIPPVPANLDLAIRNIMNDVNAVRINIYNQNGIVVFSTLHGMLGRDESDNKRFMYAINGRVASKLFYHESLNPFASSSEYDNLIETYMPIHSNQAASISGVFEIYTDVSPMVVQAEHARWIVTLGVILIMVLLYAFHVFMVRRAAVTIAQQQEVLRERSRTLEMLSAQLMNTDENERRRIAVDLHEGVAQTLGAAKLYLETAGEIQASASPATDKELLGRTIQIIQESIQEVRTLAMDLRPTTLDEFGLTKTIDWLCNEFNSMYTNIQLECRVDVDEKDVPAPLKTILYRVIKDGLNNIGIQGLADHVLLAISRANDTLQLTMEDNAVAYHPENTGTGTEQNIALSSVRERIVLSGGSFKLASNRKGGTVMIAEWPC